ncbi:hypothetical protein ACM66B_003591 [Microbotryomycetes sp. NB124-2]
MQSLAGYGSDSDDGEQPIASSSNAAPGSTASAPGSASNERSSNGQPASAGESSLPPTLTRIKGLASSSNNSRSQSPMPGVRMSSPSVAPSNASAIKLGKQRASSSSPPPFTSTRPAGNGGADDSTSDSQRNGSGSTMAPRADLESLAEFGIPPMRTGPCNPAVEAKLANFHNLSQTRGLHFNDSLLRSKAFRNPRIHAKLVEFVDVDETGTNWPKEIWDCRNIGSFPTAASLAEAQRTRSEARQAGQKPGSRSAISFAPSTASVVSSSTLSSTQPLSRDSRGRDKDRDRDRGRDRDDRYHERDGYRDKGRGRDDSGARKRSRWDAGTGHRERSPGDWRR